MKPELVAEIAFAEFTAEGISATPASSACARTSRRRDRRGEGPAATQPSPRLVGVKISNPDRVIYPESSITKGELADYYLAVADLMLAWPATAPFSLVRCPQGRAEEMLLPEARRRHLRRTSTTIPVRESDGTIEHYLYV